MSSIEAGQSVEGEPATLLLGTDAYELVHASVRSRLEEVERQQQSASRSDFTG